MANEQLVNRNKRNIREAVKTLLKSHSIEEITVNDILSEAMISRSTFYQYYHDKYEVVEELQDFILQKFAELTSKIRNREDDEVGDAYAYYTDKFFSDFYLISKVKTNNADILGKVEELLKESYKSQSDLEKILFARIFVTFMTYSQQPVDHRVYYASLINVLFRNLGIEDDELKAQIMSYIR